MQLRKCLAAWLQIRKAFKNTLIADKLTCYATSPGQLDDFYSKHHNKSHLPKFSPSFFKPRPLSFAIFLATSVPVSSCSRLDSALSRSFFEKFTLSMGPHENKFSLVSVMAAMLRDSVVVRTRPRLIPLAMITTKKSIHSFL